MMRESPAGRIPKTRNVILPMVMAGTLIALPITPAGAQDRPDFSGQWVLVKEETRQPDDGRTDNMRTYIPGAEIEITVTGGTISLIYKAWDDGRGRQPERQWRTVTWIADGQPHPNENTDREETITATWEGDRLVVISENRVGMGLTSRTMSFRKIVALDTTEDGERLVIREWLPGAPPGGPASAHLVYRRR